MSNTISGATPVIAQYLQIKATHQDCLVFFQMGDFYELFFEDAKIAAIQLDIVLTYRGQYQDQDIPMCGVPVHNYASYTEKLVQRGFKIAVCAQTESPIEAKKRGYKAIVNREIVRIITSGTLTEDHLLDAKHDNFLCVVTGNQSDFCCFFYDISTGKIHYFQDKIDILTALIHHKKPSEIIYDQEMFISLLKQCSIPQTFHQSDDNPYECLSALKPYFDDNDPLPQQALLLLSAYLKRTQCQDNILCQKPELQFYSDFLLLDDAGQLNLEIFKTLSGNKKPTLLSTLDKCKTAAGARLLAEYLNFPITNADILKQRYDAIDFFRQHQTMAENLLVILNKTADLNRILGRVKTGRASPADLGHIRNSLDIIYSELGHLQFDKIHPIPDMIMNAYNNLCTHINCYSFLMNALKQDLPISLKLGDFIQTGYDDILDEYKSLKENARQYILDLEKKYRDITDISALKIKHNNVIGYHIDVSSNHIDKMMHQEYDQVTFIHKQTLANHVRFTTQELIGLEKKISEASLSFDQREKEIFTTLCQAIDADITLLIIFANAIACLDLYASHALFSLENQYCRPDIVDYKTLKIIKGRHPVVENLLYKQSKNFIPNDVTFKNGSVNSEIWLVTGPNMGGKSTFLRQTVLMILMAQAGLFVPAETYQAGIFDKIFSRVGASDNLAEGKSTFMSEMSETAHILQQATSQSFVILDELGRGTSTYDGLAIAYSTLKYLSETIGAMGLFATHYHEMTEMVQHHKRIGNLQASVTQHQNEIIFLHKIIAGAAKKSYGIHVANLAGMPLEVIHEATLFLKSLDKKKHPKINASDTDIMPLFDTELSDDDNSPIIIEQNPVIEKIKQIDVNNLSPIDAFNYIHQWQKEL